MGGGLTPAPWGRRVAAFVIDALLLAPFVAVLFVVLGFDFHHLKNQRQGLPPADRRAEFLAAVIVAVGYHATLLTNWGGQTVGRRLLRVRVVTETGGPLSFGRAVWREAGVRALLLGGYLAALTNGAAIVPFIALADGISPLLQPERRAIHDILAGTRVIVADRAPPGGQPRQ